jgi:two-component system cell cycle sensor histidine kinase/response regulator CckA
MHIATLWWVVSLLLVALVALLVASHHSTRAVRNSEKQYRLLFEANPQPMWVFEYGSLRFLAVNEAAVKGYGYSREEFLAMTIRDIRPPEDVADFIEDVPHSREGLRNAGVWRHRRRDGSVILVEISSQPLWFDGRSACLIQAIDVTTRENNRREVAWQRDHLQNQAELIDLSNDAIITATAGQVITGWNLGAEKIYGWSRAEALGRDLGEVVQTTSPASADIDSQLRAGLHWEGELIQTRRDGRPAIIDSRQVLKVDAGGAITGILQINRDITANRELEDQLRQAQKLDSIGKLAGGVAHDFNNLMTIVSGYAGMALDELPTGHALRDSLLEIAAAATRATALTRQLLTFSRRQMRTVSHVDLNEVVLDMEKLLRRWIGEDVALSLSLDVLPAVVLADRAHIEQVILNLVINARDAMPKGGTLAIEARRTFVDASHAGQPLVLPPGWYVRLAVRDSGIGMPEDVRRQCFEPFFTTKEAGRGAGLGLSTVYGIVKQSDGFIFVDSQQGRGTTFEIFLPAVEAPAHRTEPVKEIASFSGRETILVVEDEDSLRKYVREMLERKGYTVVVAASGREALQIARTEPRTIDLLLTDMVMPEMNGAELAEAFGQARPHVPVLRMSGYSDRLSQPESTESFVQKPFTPAVLLKSIRTVLARARK